MQKYESQNLDGSKVVATYVNELFTQKEVDLAIKRATSKDVIGRIISGFYANQFRAIIIGPPQIANLLGRSLSVMLPPSIRSRVLYATEPEQIECFSSESLEHSIRLQIPISENDQRAQKQFATTKIMLRNADDSIQDVSAGTQRHIFCDTVKCKCGRLRHMPMIATGANIQCVSGNQDTFYIMDYFTQLERPSCIVNLCVADDAEIVNNFGFQKTFYSTQKQLMMYQILGRAEYLASTLVKQSEYSKLMGQENSTTFDTRAGAAHLQNLQHFEMAVYLCEAVFGHFVGLRQQEMTLSQAYTIDSFSKALTRLSLKFESVSTKEGKNGIVSLERLHKGAIVCRGWQADMQFIGGHYAYNAPRLSNCPQNNKTQQQAYLDILYKYLIEYFVSDVLDIMEGGSPLNL